MAVPDANFAWPTFVELYHREGSDRFKEGLAVALAGSAHPKDMENLLSLIRDPRNGESRLLLLLALERSKDPWAENVLRGLQGEGDPQLAQELGLILKRFEQKRKRRALRASSKKRDKGC